MVGRAVLAEGNLASLGPDAPLQGGVNLPFATNAAYVRVFDPLGQPVAEFPLGNRNAGVASFQWNGLLPDGEQAPAGDYRIAAFTRNGDVEEPLETMVASRVESVTLSAGGRNALLTTEGGQQVSLSQVKAIM